MSKRRGTYISKFDENINYGEMALKGGSSSRPLGLLEEQLDTMPNRSKIILYRWVQVKTVTYGGVLIHC
jgi:hypothetical protein